MRRPATEDSEDDDEKEDNVTVKSMLVSMVRVCIGFDRSSKY